MVKKLAVMLMMCIFLGMLVSCYDKNSSKEAGETPKDKTGIGKTMTETSKNSHTLRDIQLMLEKDFAQYNIQINKSTSHLCWSPDNRYILFEGYKEESLTPSSKDKSYKNFIVLIDFDKKEMVNIRQGYLMGNPDWSQKNQKVVFNSEGIYIYDLKNRQLSQVSKEGYMPLFSPDEAKIAYSSKSGIRVYHLDNKQDESITQKEDDIASAWFSDNRRLFCFRNNGTKLTDGAGYEQTLSIIDTQGAKKYTDVFPKDKGKFRWSDWLEQDKILHLAAGWDDGYYDYIINFKNNTMSLMGEMEAAAYGTSSIGINKDGQIVVCKNDLITLYDKNLKKLKEYRIKEDRDNGNRKLNMYHQFLPDGRIMVWHKDMENSRGAVILVDPVHETQQLAADHMLAESPSLSNDGKVIALLEDSSRMKFLMVPQKNEEKVNKEMKSLMPAKEGYEWIYNGFAEYGHKMNIKKITDKGQSLQYLIEGVVISASGMPATEKDRFVLDYTVTNNSIRENVEKIGKLPHKIKEFDLIREPLVKGNRWNEKVLIDGRETVLNSEIIETGVDSSSRKYFKVRYEAADPGYPDSKYIETRVIKQGIGFSSFENTYDKEIEFNYHVFEN